MKKTLAMILAVVMLMTACVAGTLAWLQDSTETLTNTFTVGNVTITLKESPLNDDGTYGEPAEGTQNEYQLIPGKTYTKDPTVAVAADSENCYLFVKFEENGNADTYIDYTSTLTTANGWTQGDGTNIPANVWYRTVLKADTTKSWELLADNKITINASAVTNETMEAANTAALVYTAYAIQQANGETTFTATEAWAQLSA